MAGSIYLSRTVPFLVMSVAILSSPLLSLAQTTAGEFPPWDQWRARAEQITAEIAEQSKRLEPEDQIRLAARIGLQWAEVDREKSSFWLGKALEGLERWNPGDERSKKSKMQTARWVLSQVGDDQPELAQKLADNLARYTEEAQRLSPQDKEENASALAWAASWLARKDPERAFRLGRTALEYGGSTAIVELIGSLTKDSPHLADRLFSDALSTARENRDSALLGFLAYWAASAGRVSPTQKARALEAMKEAVDSLLPSEQNPKARCQLASSASWFGEQIPSKYLGTVRATLAACVQDPQTRSLTFSGSFSDDLRPRTAADYVRAAESTTNPREQANYFEVAAAKTANAGDLLEAIRLADKVPEGYRNANWNLMRVSLAERASILLFRRGDLAGMHQLIASTPQRLRPYVQTGTAERLTATGNLETALQLAADARRLLQQTEHPDAAAYYALVNIITALAPEALPDLLKELINRLNETAAIKTARSPFVQVPQNDFVPDRLSSVLLEVDARIVPAARQIRDPYMRVNFLLGLLHSALERSRAKPLVSKVPS